MAIISTKEQLSYIEADINSSLIVDATAGSGKSSSSEKRLKFLLDHGILPETIIFFSFTNAAVDVLRTKIPNEKIKVTTIHAFCRKILFDQNLQRDPVTIINFIEWFKNKFQPLVGAPKIDKENFDHQIHDMYTDADIISSSFSSYKLQSAEGIWIVKPDHFDEYELFLKQTNSMDFSDMLIEVRNLFRSSNAVRKRYKDKFKYVFVDEFQDTSAIQMEILLYLNAKCYTIIGDQYQAIYGYTGANAKAIIEMLLKRRTCKHITLSVNFRSKKSIVEYSNDYSGIKAIAHSNEEGIVHKDILNFNALCDLIKTKSQVAVLARTNKALKAIEYQLLLLKVPMQYRHYINQKDITYLKENNIHSSLKTKLNNLSSIFSSNDELIAFIESNHSSQSLSSTIHKSKGFEYDTCIVVDSVSPAILQHNNMVLSDQQAKKVSFDINSEESENVESIRVHYVAATRAMSELYFYLTI